VGIHNFTLQKSPLIKLLNLQVPIKYDNFVSTKKTMSSLLQDLHQFLAGNTT
jgi:hypothetical protein